MWKISIKSTVCLVLDNRKLVLTSIGEIISLIKGTVKVVNDERCWYKLGIFFFKTPATFNGEKKGRRLKYFDTNSYYSSLITYGRQLKATLEYTCMQLTPTEMQKSDN